MAKYRDCLFSAFHGSALAAFAGAERTLLFALHGALNALPRSFPILGLSEARKKGAKVPKKKSS